MFHIFGSFQGPIFTGADSSVCVGIKFILPQNETASVCQQFNCTLMHFQFCVWNSEMSLAPSHSGQDNEGGMQEMHVSPE